MQLGSKISFFFKNRNIKDKKIIIKYKNITIICLKITQELGFVLS